MLVWWTTALAAALLLCACTVSREAEAHKASPSTDAEVEADDDAHDDAVSPLHVSRDCRSDIRGALGGGGALPSATADAGSSSMPTHHSYAPPSATPSWAPPSALSVVATPYGGAVVVTPSEGRALLDAAVDDGLYGGLQPLVLFDVAPAAAPPSLKKAAAPGGSAPASSRRKKKVSEHVKTPPPRRSGRVKAMATPASSKGGRA